MTFDKRDAASSLPILNRRSLCVGAAAGATLLKLNLPLRAEQKTLRFGVGPTLPSPTDTQKLWDPLFKHIAAQAGTAYTLSATTDWAGIYVALASGQLDIAYLGSWGYTLAKRQAKIAPLAAVKLKGSPSYRAIVVARKGLEQARWPEDARNMQVSFADKGSTTGWLIPYYWLVQKGIDPKTYFKYRDGATHAANEVAVANSQVDFATDYDYHRELMIGKGTIKPEDSNVVWQSDPIPYSLIVARADVDPAIISRVKEALLALTDEQAKQLMPPGMTGFAPTQDSNYDIYEKAGTALGLLK